MARAKNDDVRGVKMGVPIAFRFGLAMSFALALVMAGAGYLLSENARQIAEDGIENALQSTALVTSDIYPSHQALRAAILTDVHALAAEGTGVALPWGNPEEKRLMEDARDRTIEATEKAVEGVFAQHGPARWERDGQEEISFADGRGLRFPITVRIKEHGGSSAYLYQIDNQDHLVSPRITRDETKRGIFGLILGMTIAVVVVGTGIAALIASRVSKPIVAMVGDVGQIASGNLSHRTRLKGGGELAMLAHSLDRMAESLSEAQEAERELSVREREMEVAREVREALLPQKIPTIPGYSLAALHLTCPEPEGDFHDYIAVEGGRLGLLVCQVNGKGVPGALVGATARAYLRNELERGGDLSEAFKKVNRELARDVRRGMYITALYAVFDPAENVATVVCAGHKLPLVRYAAAEGKLRTVQPEGIALAFDRGPVFEKNLQVQRVPLEKGDRLFLANTGAVRVLDEEGKELGEKGFYQILLKASRSKAGELLSRVRSEIEAHAGGEPLPADVSVLLLAREE